MTTYVANLPTNLDILGSRARLALIRHLVVRRQEFTGRELARTAGIEAKQASQALRHLLEVGMVRRRRAGRAFLYSLNDNHYLVSSAVAPAFHAEERWDESLGTEVRALARPDAESVILYGSWARGTADARSDIDLAVIIRRGGNKRLVENRLAEQHERLADRFTHAISFLVLGRREFRNRAAHRDALVAEILESGRVLAGKSFAGLLAYE